MDIINIHSIIVVMKSNVMVREKEDGREEHTLTNSWRIHCVM